MEKADAILAQCGLSTPGNNSGVPSSPTEHTVGLQRQEGEMAPVTEAQANALLAATGVLSEEIKDKGRTSGRTTKRRRQAVKSNEEPEKMEKSTTEEEEERAAEEEVQEEGSGGVKNLERRQTALDKATNASIGSEFEWNQEGESPEDRAARLAAARANTAALQKRRVANAGRLGHKKGEGAGRPLRRKVGALNASKKWSPVSPRVENLGTTVGSLGTNFANGSTQTKRGRNLKKTKLKEDKSFAAFINEVFKNV